MSRIVIEARESGTSTGRYVDKLIENLHKLKPEHEIIVLTKNKRLDYIKKIAPNFTVIESNYKEFTFEEQIGLLKQIRSLKPDLVHFAIVQQPILYRGKNITTMHDLTTVRFKNPAKNPVVFFVKQQVYKVVNKVVARKANVVLTPTQYVKDDVASFTHIDPNKIVVTYESGDYIEGPAKEITSLKGKKFIMYIGRPTPHKNLGRLIDVFKILQEETPDLHLVLAGKKDVLYEQHEKDAKHKGIKNVIFTGFIEDSELKWLYQNTACYVFPSLSEGFGLPPLEAMAHRAPVAASNATCIPEVCGDGAVYFNPVDVKEMAKVINNVINDKNLKKDLVQKGSKQLTKYSWGKMAEETLDQYNKVLTK